MGEKVQVLVNGEQFAVTVVDRRRDGVTFEIGDRSYCVEFAAAIESTTPQKSAAARSTAGSAPAARTVASGGGWVIVAPIPGVVVELLVAVGDRVESGAIVARLEAMKMQNNILTSSAGRVKQILVAAGDEVSDAQPLIEFES